MKDQPWCFFDMKLYTGYRVIINRENNPLEVPFWQLNSGVLMVYANGAMKTVYVDGQHGTTGLEIMDRLEKRTDLELLTIGHEQRRDAGVRERLLNEADLVFLCLPDDAAREAVKLIRNDATRVIDASTAHRTGARSSAARMQHSKHRMSRHVNGSSESMLEPKMAK